MVAPTLYPTLNGKGLRLTNLLLTESNVLRSYYPGANPHHAMPPFEIVSSLPVDHGAETRILIAGPGEKARRFTNGPLCCRLQSGHSFLHHQATGFGNSGQCAAKGDCARMPRMPRGPLFRYTVFSYSSTASYRCSGTVREDTS